MPLIDFATIAGRATWVRAKAGLADHGPPFSMHKIIEGAFPDIAVSGADLPRGVNEMAERRPDGKRILWYARAIPHPAQRVALAHGLYHFLTDLRVDYGVRECNPSARVLERSGALPVIVNEVSCDLFAGELLTPTVLLDAAAPTVLFPRDTDHEGAFGDAVDGMASMFNVPASFVRWRLYDLMHLRRTHYFVR